MRILLPLGMETREVVLHLLDIGIRMLWLMLLWRR